MGNDGAADLGEVVFASGFPTDRPFVSFYLRLSQANRQRAGSSPIWSSQAKEAN